jgi:hypothetical protein
MLVSHVSRRRAAYVTAGALCFASATAHADPTKDECINANEAAQALRSAGKLRDARDKLTLCVAATCPGPVRDDCSERLSELQKALPTVVFAVRSAGGADVSLVRVKMDGALLTAKLDGRAIPLDPGPHSFVFEARGFAPFETTLLIREGEKDRHEAIALPVDAEIQAPAPPPALPPSEPSATAGAGPAPSTVLPPETPSSHGSTTRALSFGALGLGVAGVAVGSIFGGLALQDKQALDRDCKGGKACPPSAQSDINLLHSNGTIANVAFGVGIVGLAAGAVLFFVSRGGHSDRSGVTTPAAPFIGFGATGLRGTFQ